MSTNERRPLIVCPATVRSLSSIFHFADRQVTVSAPEKLITQLLQGCDGIKSLSNVIEMLSVDWDRKTIREFMAELERLGIIRDANSMSGFVWPFVKNPTKLFRSVTDEQIAYFVQKAHKRHERNKPGIEFQITKKPLQELLEKRKSIRTFSDKQVPQEIINLMLWSGYGIVGDHLILSKKDPQRIKVWQHLAVSRHTVPSAGALYPFKIGLVLLRPTDQCPIGIYEICFMDNDAIKLIKINENCLSAYQAFADPTIFNQAQGVIVIAGSFDKCGEKYGNRSMLYVPIEAGHIAQNIHLAAVDSSISTLEVGGFLEETLRESIKFPKDYWPLTTILFGYPENEEIERKVQDDIDISWASKRVKDYKLPFLMAFAKPNNWKNSDSACGRSVNPEMAQIKALAEAEEWSACGRIPKNLIESSFGALPKAIDPRDLISFHPKQYQRKSFALNPFDVEQQYKWINGKDIINNSDVYILADCAFFPYHPSYPRYCFANSSGAAAHYDKNAAIQSATLELIERDAFMVAYLNRLTMPVICNRTLPEDIQRRLRALNRAGFKTVVKDLTLDLAPVVFVFAQNQRLAFTTCAGCCDFNYAVALDHALMEVEAAAYCRLVNSSAKPINPRLVRFTNEHGALYEQFKYFRRADFLTKSSKKINFQVAANSAAKSWQELIDRLISDDRSLIIVDLPAKNGGGETELKTVRVFIPGIVPISFGYGVEPLGMRRVYDLPVQLGLLYKPMTYGQLTKFPHPYT